MNKKISEISTQAPALADLVTGLQSGDNANFTLQGISDLFQDQIDTATPLPDGTYAKVMYYTLANGWGASQEVSTNGYILGIGVPTPNGGIQLEVENQDGNYDFLTAMNIRDNTDAVVKTLAYSKNGIFFVTDGGVPANIDIETNANNYGMFLEKGLVLGDKAYLTKDKALSFGSIDGTTGVFSESANIVYKNSGDYLSYGIGGHDFMRVKTNVDSDIFTLGSTSPIFLMAHNIASADSLTKTTQTLFNVSKPYQQDNLNLCVVGNCGSEILDRSIFRIQNGDYPKQEDVDPTKIIMDFRNNGQVRMRNLPTSSSGLPTGTLWNNSGVLNIVP